MSTATSYDAESSAARASNPSAEPEVDPQLVQDARNEIRQLVHEVTALAQSDIPVLAFYEGLLTRVVSALAAQGGAVWTVEEGQLQLSYRINYESAGLNQENQSRHAGLIDRVIQTGQAMASPPRSGLPDTTSAGNPTDLLLLLAPIKFGDDALGVIEIMQRPGAGPTTQRGYLRFLLQMCDLAGTYLRNRRLRQYAERESLWKKLETFLHHLHQSLDLDATTYAVVNEGRQLVGCDRVGIALKRGERFELAAVSGLDNLDRRAQQARALARLIETALKTGEPLWCGRGCEPPAPQIDTALSEYLDRSHSKAVGVLPLRDAAKRIVAAVVVENLTDDVWSETLQNRVFTLVLYASPAIAHALEHSRVRVPLLKPLTDAIDAVRGKYKYQFAAVAAAFLLLTGSLVSIPASFDIAARGKLQPSDRFEIFAPESGTVTKVAVGHGSMVHKGDVLAELTSTEIEVELAELLGRQSVAQQQLESYQRTLLESSRGGRPKLSVADENRIAGDILQIKQTLSGIEDELELIRAKQESLVVRAQHDGEVVTWQVEQQLLRRPVMQGQSLLTVVDPSGPWELELALPERRLAHLDRAGEGSTDPLRVTFMLSTQPGIEYEGRVVEIERTAEARGEEGTTVLVRVAIDRDRIANLRSDTTVTAKVHCGTRSLGYVWFCDLIETVQTHVLFWL